MSDFLAGILCMIIGSLITILLILLVLAIHEWWITWRLKKYAFVRPKKEKNMPVILRDQNIVAKNVKNSCIVQNGRYHDK